MIENLDFNFISDFLDYIYLQTYNFEIWGIFGISRDQLGNGDPVIKETIPTLFSVAGFGILIGFFNSVFRKKIIDQRKMKMMINETKKWRKEKMDAIKSKDHEKIVELNKKTSYMNKISLETFQMNMKPMIFTFIPLMLIYYFILPQLFTNTVALSPISLNIFPGNFFHFTCIPEQVLDPNNICMKENSVYRWAWYFLSSVAFSGIIMRITRTSQGLI